MRFKTTYEQRLDQKFNQGIEQGIERGLEQGVQRGLDLDKIDVIQGMLAKECDWAFIESITHINEAGYAQLQEKYK